MLPAASAASHTWPLFQLAVPEHDVGARVAVGAPLCQRHANAPTETPLAERTARRLDERAEALRHVHLELGAVLHVRRETLSRR